MQAWRAFLLTSFIPAVVWSAEIRYSVNFEGLEDPDALKELRSISQLISLRKKPPSSLNSLRFRAESDLPDFLKVLKSLGYFEATVDFSIEESTFDYAVTIKIEPGPLYTIESYEIYGVRLEEFPCLNEEPADTKIILEQEGALIALLAEKGYPFAEIKQREIIADGATKKVKIVVTIDPGPIAHFGDTSIVGNTCVRTAYIEQRIPWCIGDIYNSTLVNEVQEMLMDSGLFCSVYVSHDKALDLSGKLPMRIALEETKHKSVGLGISYLTTYGPTLSFGWENRNASGMGRQINIQGDIGQRGNSGLISYHIPDFRTLGQNYTIQAQANYDKIKAYHDQCYTFLNQYDRQFGDNIFFSIGAEVEYLIVRNSVQNGRFVLFDVPIYLRFSNVADPLNPLSGGRIEIEAYPTINFMKSTHFYYQQQVTFCSYLPIWNQEVFILAQRFTLGFTLSNGLSVVPVPKRFLGGTEDNLRGYKYMTVSPLAKDRKPIGGRSAIYYTIEPRFRISKSLGIVPFFDLGNVYLDAWPNFGGKWRKSLGIGLRYFSFVGPLRFDLAFPLNPRRGIDPKWWVLVSLGQTF